MSKAKMTAREYRNSIEDLTAQLNALYSKISMRLFHLCKYFPDAIVLQKGIAQIKAKSIGNIIYINRIDVDERLQYIEAIEKYVADQNPVKQLKINF